MSSTRLAKEADYSIRAIAIESNSGANLVNFIANRFTPIKDFLKSVTDFSFNPIAKETYELTKAQKAITGQLNPKNYLRVATKVTVNTIPGLSSSLIDMHEDVVIAIKSIQEFKAKILDPYYVHLSIFVSNKDARNSSKNNTFLYKKLEHDREALAKHNSMHFQAKATTGAMQLIDLVKRAQDLPKAFHEASVAKVEFSKINFNSIKDGLEKCSEGISMIIESANKGEIEGISPEVYESLANGAYEMAKQAEAITALSVMIIGYITASDNILTALQIAEKNGEF